MTVTLVPEHTNTKNTYFLTWFAIKSIHAWFSMHSLQKIIRLNTQLHKFLIHSEN